MGGRHPCELDRGWGRRLTLVLAPRGSWDKGALLRLRTCLLVY